MEMEKVPGDMARAMVFARVNSERSHGRGGRDDGGTVDGRIEHSLEQRAGCIKIRKVVSLMTAGRKLRRLHDSLSYGLLIILSSI